MASDRMCGVVLWSSNVEGRAVIWCEDHGKLAFYAKAASQRACCDMHAGVALDAGDLIEFDVEDQAHQRRAHNPRLLVPDHAPCIATDLRQEARVQQAAPSCCASAAEAAMPRQSAEIVEFTPRAAMAARRRATA